MSITDRILGRDEPSLDGHSVDLTRDELHTVLKNQRRRAIIRALCEDFDGEASLSDLAEYVAAVECGHDGPEDVSSTERKRVYVALYQSHLPDMRRWGVVDWDGKGGSVRATPMAGDLRRYLAATEGFAAGESGGVEA